MSKVVVLLSGGMDSTVLLYHHLRGGDEVRAISFNYGQRHEKELLFARKTANSFKIPHAVVDLSELAKVLPGSSQTQDSIAVPEGRYDEESMKLTVVPNRNMILLSIAIGHAIAHKFDQVSYAAHAGDHSIYPDCRPEFALALGALAMTCDWHPVVLETPFINNTKADIVKKGIELGVDFRDTWSCYQRNQLHCGRCGTCTERREAFHLCATEDPTPYAVNAPSVAQLVANDWHLPS